MGVESAGGRGSNVGAHDGSNCRSVTSSLVANQHAQVEVRARPWMHAPRLLACTLVLFAAGVATEALTSADGWERDLATGLAVGIAGLVVLHRRPRDPVGWLLYVAALAWFAGSLTSDAGSIGDFGEQALF